MAYTQLSPIAIPGKRYSFAAKTPFVSGEGLIKFTKGADTFIFTKGRSYPLDDPAQVSVITSLSAGMQMYAFDQDVIVDHYNLYLKNLCQIDYDNFSNWLQSIAVGPKNTFTYKDEDGNNHTVRLLNIQNPLKKISHENFEGTIELRKEI